MTFVLISAALVAFLTLMARSISRERAARRKSGAAHARVLAEHQLEEAFVSEADGSLVGISLAHQRLVVGDDAGDRVLPFTAIRAVEGVRDGQVLVRADRDGAATAPAGEQAPHLLPERIRSLSLRITFDDPDQPAHSVLFFDGGKHGAEPINEHFRQQAALVEAWYARLARLIQA